MPAMCFQMKIPEPWSSLWSWTPGPLLNYWILLRHYHMSFTVSYIFVSEVVTVAIFQIKCVCPEQETVVKYEFKHTCNVGLFIYTGLRQYSHMQCWIVHLHMVTSIFTHAMSHCSFTLDYVNIHTCNVRLFIYIGLRQSSHMHCLNVYLHWVTSIFKHAMLYCSFKLGYVNLHTCNIVLFIYIGLRQFSHMQCRIIHLHWVTSIFTHAMS